MRKQLFLGEMGLQWRIGKPFLLLCVLGLFLLAGCASSGGGSSSGDSNSGGDSSSGGSSSGGGASIPQGRVFPRTAPVADVLNTPDDSGYAAKKRDFGLSAEYKVNYRVTGRDNEVDSHLGRINAADAYARGATGAGETIVVVDTGIRETHREFAGSGKVTKVTSNGYSPTDAEKSHGTAVASLAVGNRDGGSGLNMHGVAFDANVHFGEIRIGTSDGVYRPLPRGDNSPPADDMNADDMNDATFYGSIIGLAEIPRAAIVNLSFVVDGVISEYEREELRSRFGRTATALAQASTEDADKKIIVWGAGNNGSLRLPNGDPAPVDSPAVLSGLGVYFPELQGHVLTVVALDQDGSIASYSNRCGIAKSFCLAAPGSAVVTAHSSGDKAYGVGFGTSFSAPLVSGSLALLRQYFRQQLGNTELVDRLLATANREGIYSDSDTYGHGLVDLDAATKPVGSLMTGLPGDSGSRPLSGSGIALSGTAFGSSLQQQLADMEVVGFDSMGAPFFQSAAALVEPMQEDNDFSDVGSKVLELPLLAYANNAARLLLAVDGGGAITETRLSFADGWWFSYGHHGGHSLGLYDRLSDDPWASATARGFSDPLAFAAPYLSLVRDGPGLGWSRSISGSGRFGFALMHGASRFGNSQNRAGERGLGALLSMTINGDRRTGLSLQVGAVREVDGFLGARPQGAFSTDAHGMTTFAGINGIWTLGGDRNKDNSWRVLVSAYLGRTRPQVGGAELLRDASTIVSSAFSIGIARSLLWRPGDWFGARLSQPLRAERGSIGLRLPAGRTKYREVVYKNYNLDMVPAGRNLEAEAIYSLPISNGALQTGIGFSHHPQHNSERSLRPFIRLSFVRSF